MLSSALAVANSPIPSMKGYQGKSKEKKHRETPDRSENVQPCFRNMDFIQQIHVHRFQKAVLPVPTLPSPDAIL